MKKIFLAFIMTLFYSHFTQAQVVGTERLNSNYWFLDDKQVQFGNFPDVAFEYDTGQTNDAFVLGLSTDSESFLIMQKADMGTNVGLSDAGTPTVYILNSDPTKWVSISHNGTNAVIDTNTGIVTFPDGLDLGAGDLSFGDSAIFEGTTADDFETTLTVVDPTADRTVTLPNASGAAILSSAGVADAANAISGGTGTFVFEGTTADGFETTIGVTDPTADQTWTVPNFAVNAAFFGSTLTTNNVDAANSVWGVSNGVSLEGATANGFETTVTTADPTADNTITLPDASGTVIVSGAAASLASVTATGSVLSTSATDIGWSVVSGADTACNTTCTNACVFGQNTADMSIVDCAGATADVCVCAGAN